MKQQSKIGLSMRGFFTPSLLGMWKTAYVTAT